MEELRGLDEEYERLIQALEAVRADPSSFPLEDILPSQVLPRLEELSQKKAETGVELYDLIDEYIQSLDVDLSAYESKLRTSYARLPENGAPVTSEFVRKRSRKDGQGPWDLTYLDKHADELLRMGIMGEDSNKADSGGKEKSLSPPGRNRRDSDVSITNQEQIETEAMFQEMPLDPNEPRYCLCNRVSFGNMVCCDNDDCAIEWFHFDCVGLSSQPKGQWFCPQCTKEKEIS